jgi:soluble lytic murein transglycosylase-like protein
MRKTNLYRPRRREPGGLTRWIGQAGLLLVGGLAVGAGLAGFDRLQAADPVAAASADAAAEVAMLTAELEAARGRLAVNDLELDRLRRVSRYSSLYKVPADIAAMIYDAALAEDIHPSLGFQLVKVESGFRAKARSSAGALGYTQVRLGTARAFDSTLTERELLRPETNLRIGFRILRGLLRQFDHDLDLALRAYNLGPTGAVRSLADTTDGTAVESYVARVSTGVKRATNKRRS